MKTILADLRTRGLHYEVVAEVRDIDIELPRLNPDADGNPDPQDIRWTDRDVLLACTDAASDVTVLGARSGRFSSFLDYGGGIAIPRGWVSGDFKVRGVPFRVVSSHLEDGDASVQMAQAEELLAVGGDSGLPTLFIGDYNSNANPDATSAPYDFLIASGLTDAWSAAHPHDPGFTCCQAPDLLNATSLLDQRIDLVLFRGPVQVLDVARVGASVSDKVAGLWPSDHAGVAATLRIAR